jgi:carbon dioxide concentrating mechanism protein CcmM
MGADRSTVVRRGAQVALSAAVAALSVTAGCGDDGGEDGEDEETGLSRVEPGESVYGSTFVSPGIELSGELLVGADHSFVTANTRFDAADGHSIEIGNGTNAQDNVGMSAAAGSSTVGDETSLAHHAIVEDSEIGNDVFLGFIARVTDSTVEDGATILHAARVEGVTIPENALVGVGEVVTSQQQADALPETDRDTEEFKHAVLDVNAEFAEGYIEIYESEGESALTGIGPNPVTSFNPGQVTPEVEQGQLADSVRVVGDVRLGTGARIGERSAIRADEGIPITIGADARIGDRVTFHALEHTELTVGDDFSAGDDAVVHGPLEVGDGVTVGRAAVVFRAIVGDRVEIGDGAVIAGPGGDELTLEVPSGTVIPDGRVVTAPEDLENLSG